MSYATYTTEAIVCGSVVSNTSDKSFLLFTRDAGMVWATARSVREEKSKQRYALQDFSIIRVSLVKGKASWRIGSVEAIGNPFLEASSREARAGLSVIVKALRRFIHGEVPYQVVYDDVVLCAACIAVADAEDIVRLQEQFMLRLLYQLGYVAPHDSYNDILENTDPWSVPATLSGEGRRALERATTASHL